MEGRFLLLCEKYLGSEVFFEIVGILVLAPSKFSLLKFFLYFKIPLTGYS